MLNTADTVPGRTVDLLTIVPEDTPEEVFKVVSKADTRMADPTTGRTAGRDTVAASMAKLAELP